MPAGANSKRAPRGLPDPATLALVRAAPIPVAVVSGFLGSGKTSLINRALRRPELGDSAVIVNEFGEIGLDHLLVETAQEDTLLLDNGCLCCASRGDLVRALGGLLERRERRELPPYRRVIVETSGLADPTPILQTFMTDPLRLGRYRLAGLVTLVDALFGGASLDAHSESRQQVRLADRILISKTDLTAAGDVAALRDRLRRLSQAPVIDRAGATAGRALLFDFPAAPAAAGLADSAPAHDRGADAYVTMSRRFETRLTWDRLEAWTRDLLARHGEGLLRLKGLFRLQGEARPLVLQAVRHLFHRPSYLRSWPPDLPAGQIVVIAQADEAAELRRLLDALAA